jgi:hypothetical protein
MVALTISWSSSDFIVDGIAYQGLSIFVRPGSMRIEYLPTEYCVHVSVVRPQCRSCKTWKAYGLLLGYLRFMESRGFDWCAATKLHLSHFGSELERRRLTRSTIARRMTIVCNYYEWAHQAGHIATLPYRFPEILVRIRELLGDSRAQRLRPSERRQAQFVDKIRELERRVDAVLAENLRLMRLLVAVKK